MGVRGRPERPRFSAPEDLSAHDNDEATEVSFGLDLEAADLPFAEFGADLLAVHRPENEFGFDLTAADQSSGSFGMDIAVVESDAGEETVTAFGAELSARGPAGLAAPPRIWPSGALRVGQEALRRGEMIPEVD